MTKLLFHQHLGLGDHIDCNGMVRHILEHKDYDCIDLFVKKNNTKMVSFLYRDDERIKIIPIEGNEYDSVREYAEKQIDYKLLKVVHEFYKHQDGKNCR